MQSVSVIYPNGYIANIGGPLNIETDEGTAWNNPGTGAKVGVITAPLVGLGLGAAIGSAAHTTQTTNFGGTTMTSGTAKGFAIGSIVGLAAGSVVSFVLLARSHHFYMQAGSPLEMTLTEPLTLALGPVTDTGQKAGAQPAPCPFPPGALLRHPCLLPRLRGLATFPATRAHPTRTFPAHRLWGIPPEPLAPSPRNTANSADPLPVPLVK